MRRFFLFGCGCISHQRFRSSGILFALWLVFGMCGADSAFADLQLLDLSSTWRYQQTTNLDGLSWQAAGYDDSGWPAGRGLFYVESNPAVTPRNTLLTIGRTTYYFCTPINFPVAPTNLVITFSARIDDGAVFYVNGRELQRIRMPAPPASVSYDTLATATPAGGDATAADVFSFSGDALTNFVTGTNVIAVEVHQNALNSDDVVFGAGMTVTFTNSPPVLVQAPVDTQVVDGRAVSLSAVVGGEPAPALQWYKDGVALRDSTNTSLSFSRAVPSDAGLYQLEATNTLGRLLSPAARLTVLADTNPPTLLSVLAQKNLTNVQVSFSEAVDFSTAANTNNYALFQAALPANRLRVLNAVPSGNWIVLLTTEPRLPNRNYTLEVTGVRDISSSSNAIPVNAPARLPLHYEVDLVSVDAQTLWSYTDGYPVPTNWAAIDFSATNWHSGPGVFAAGTVPSSPDPVRTGLYLNPVTSNAFSAYYFRTVFDLPGPIDRYSLRLREIADDGAVFYLNGSEFFSIGMSSTRPVAYSAIATRSVGTPRYEPTFPEFGWNVSATNLVPAGNVFAAEVHQYPSGLSDVAFAANLAATATAFYPHLQLSVPVQLEGSGTVTNQAAISLLEPLATNLVIQLASSNPADISVPAEITLLSGETNAGFNLIIGDNTLLDGPRAVTLTAQSDGIPPATRIVQVLDNETNSLAVVLPASVAETNINFTGEVRFGQPAAVAVTVSLNSSDPRQIAVPPSVLMPAGATSVVFQATIIDDVLLDGPQLVTVTADVAGWPGASATILVSDNDLPTIALQAPATAGEWNGTLTNAGKVILGGITMSNVVITLQSANPALLVVPTNVLVLAGQSSALFDITLLDNAAYEPPRPVTISAVGPGFSAGACVVTVLDDDPHHFNFSTVASPQEATVPFSLSITALGADGTVVTNFGRSINVLAAGLSGPLGTQVVGPFSKGRWSGNVSVPSPDRLVGLSSDVAPGESNPFNVEAPHFNVLSQPTGDIAFSPRLGILFATVPASGGVYSNTLLAIDPRSGTITNSYPVGYDPGQLELAPDEQFLYLTVSNRFAMRRFDLATRTAGPMIPMGKSFVGTQLYVQDMAILGGVSNSVVVKLDDTSGNSQGVWRYDNGNAAGLGQFALLDPYTIVANPSNETVYAYQFNNQFPLMRGLARPGSSLTVTNGLLHSGGMVYRDGVLYDYAGRALVADTFALLGDYPQIQEHSYDRAIPEVDPDLKRTFYLTGYESCGAYYYTLKAYDRDRFALVGRLPIPVSLLQGGPGRLLRCSPDSLVFNTGTQIWFVRSGVLQWTNEPANLVLTQSAAPLPAVIGSNLVFTLTVSNAGPGLATLVRVSNSLPANVQVMAIAADMGTVAPSTNTVLWDLSRLDPGSNASLQVSLRLGSGGWIFNRATATEYEQDADFGDNVSELALYAQLPPAGSGAYMVELSCEDMLYDPVQDRLLLSVGSSPQFTNGIAVFNPYDGLTESFAALGKKPSRLGRTDGGQYLYVSLPEDALVRRLTLPGFAQDLEFSLGGEMIYDVWYPFYARELATIPGDPEALAAWRVRRAGPMAGEYGEGIAIFHSGTMGSNVTEIGGSFTLEADSDTGALYAFNPASDFRNPQGLYRCYIGPSGATNSPLLIPENSFPGQGIRYALGQMFSTKGRVARLQPPTVDWIYAGSDNAALVCPDGPSGRVFFLVETNGWQIRCYDIDQRYLLGSIPVPYVAGAPSSLVRFSTNGLAFRTSSNQVFVVRTPLLQPSLAADLSVSIDGPNGPVVPGAEALFIVSLTNQGPHAAQQVTVTNLFSPALNIEWSFCTDGTIQATNGATLWTSPQLSAGQGAFAAIVVRPSQQGIVAISSFATAATLDSNTGDNSAFAVLKVGGELQLDNVFTVPLALNDLVWVSSLGRLVGTCGTNTANWSGALVSINPSDLAVEFKRRLGNNAGRLALSGDERMLYAGVESGVNTVALPDFAVTNRFLLLPGTYAAASSYAYDLKVLPGDNRSAAIAARSGNGVWITAFDSGIARTNTDSFYSASVSLQLGDDPLLLYCNDYWSGLRRYSVSNSQIQFLDADATLFPLYTSMDIVWGRGWLYSSRGNVADPLRHAQVGAIPGIPAGSKVLYDAASARVFYLSPQGNLLQAFDGPSLLPVGSRFISGVNGTPDRFLRWGSDGFAFTSTDGRLFLFRSSLLATNPPADVSASITHSPAPYISGSNVVSTLTLSNSGPNNATDVSWNQALPAGTRILNATASAGSLSIAANTVSGSIPSMGARSTVTVDVTFVAPAPGIITNQVTTTASSTDPDFGNNLAVALLWVQSPTGLPPVLSLSLPLKDVARDPLRPLLYASFGSSAGPLANSVVTIDPINGSIGSPVRIGANPGILTPSLDGRFLYVALDSAGTVQKLALPGLETVSSFVVPNNQTVARMAVSPLDPDTVVIRRVPDNAITMHVAGVRRPGELTYQNLFAFNTNGHLFACNGYNSGVPFYRVNTGEDGLTLLESQPAKQSLSYDLKGSGGLLFFDLGMVLDPETTRVHATMPVPYNSLVEPDLEAGRVFYLTSAGTTWSLRAFDVTQGVEVGAVRFSSLSSAPTRLVRWGTNGLAFVTSNSLTLLRGQLVPAGPPVDVVLQQSLTSNTGTTNDTFTAFLRLTNLGPVTASGVVVTQAFSSAVTNLSFTASAGSAAYTNGVAIWQIGDLPAGATESLSVSFGPTQPGTLTISSSASHNLNDVFWGNNTALNAIQILTPATSNVLQLRIPVGHLVYDRVRNLIYASTPATNGLAGNLIAAVDPVTARVVNVLPAGSQPDKLAISDDARFLYVAQEGRMGVQRFDLPSNVADMSFAFGTNDIYYAHDLQVQPGHPQTLSASLGSYNYAYPYPGTVAVYDSGVPRPQSGGPSLHLAFSAQGSQLFGFLNNGYGFLRMPLGPAGILTNEVFQNIYSDPGDLRLAWGLLYSYSGQAIEPNAAVVVGSATNSGPLAVDEALGRVFYVVRSGTNSFLTSFELGTLRPMGTQLIPDVRGTPDALIRCGADRLAFRTSSNQLFVVRSSLVPTNVVSPANVAVIQKAVQDFTAGSETLRFFITVTNQGPGQAPNVLLAIRPPSRAATITLELPTGASTNVNGSYLCGLGSLPAGQGLSVLLSAVITNTSYYSNFVSVSAAAPDPDSADNISVAQIQGLFFQRPDTVQVYPENMRALAYDPLGQRLFAAMPPDGSTNTIAWFDPQSAALLGSRPVDVSADSMLITADGLYCYLSSSSIGLIQRIHLPSLTPDLTFTPPGASAIASVALIPGHPDALAVTYYASNNAVCAIFDDGVARPNQVIGMPYSLLACSSDGGALFGYANTGTGGDSPDVFRMSINAAGLQLLDHGPSDTPYGYNHGMVYTQNRLVFANGNVLNPATWAEETAFQIGYWGNSVAAIPGLNRIAFLWPPSYYPQAHVEIHAFSTRQMLADVPLDYLADFGNLTYCGADRLAVRSDRGIYFIRSASIPAADLTLQGTASTNALVEGETLTLRLAVTNTSLHSVSGVWLTNILPAGLDLVSMSTTVGTVGTNDHSVFASLGTLDGWAGGTVTLTLSASGAVLGSLTNVAWVSGTTLEDPIPFNNRAEQQFVVLPKDSDADGMPDDWELTYGLNPNSASDALLDPDGDGTTNLQEYLAGTNPLVPDLMQIVSGSFAATDRFELVVRAPLGVGCMLLDSTNLVDWRATAYFVGQGTNQVLPLNSSPGVANSFYRLMRTNSPPQR